MGKKSGSGQGLSTPFSGLKLKILKFFDADPGSGMEKIRIREVTQFRSGINIPDPKHCPGFIFLLLRIWPLT
jgi:hypothetical protein